MSISFVALAFIFGELFLMASKRFETEIRAQVVTKVQIYIFLIFNF